jgi:hypothetical protein
MIVYGELEKMENKVVVGYFVQEQLKELNKTTKYLSVAGVSSDIRTWCLLNASQPLLHCVQSTVSLKYSD